MAIFDTDGAWVGSVGGTMANGAALGEVNAVVVDRSGRMFVLDTSMRIFVIDADGTPVAVIDRTEPDLGFVDVASFALDEDGRIYFADIGETTHARLVIGQLEAPLWPPD